MEAKCPQRQSFPSSPRAVSSSAQRASPARSGPSTGARAILDALDPADHAQEDLSEAPYCVTCGSPIGIYMADGPYYRHYRDTEDGDHERYSVDHPTVVGWRQATSP
jgi:hypothetical protein